MNLIERFSYLLNGQPVPAPAAIVPAPQDRAGPGPSTSNFLQNAPERRGGYEVVAQALAANRGGHRNVTPDSSLSQAAVWACVRVLSETLASLPLFMYERQVSGKRRAVEHDLYPILHDQANPEMTAFAFRETMQAHLALWGNAYAQIIYDANGHIAELWPLRPDMMRQSRIEAGMRWYLYQHPDGKMDWYSQDTIWHIPGLGDGINGYSPIGLMRRSIGLSMAAEEFGSRFFENDATIFGIRVEDETDATLFDHRIRSGADAGVHEQFFDVF